MSNIQGKCFCGNVAYEISGVLLCLPRPRPLETKLEMGFRDRQHGLVVKLK